MSSIPPDPSEVVTRRCARVLVVDAADRVLLMHGGDPHNPADRYWFTMGGGLEPGEDPAHGAARELAEEIGLVVPAEALGDPVWHDVAEFPFDGRWYRQDQDFFFLRVTEWETEVDRQRWTDIERRTVDVIRWWTIEELENTEERYYPENLPELLRSLKDQSSTRGEG